MRPVTGNRNETRQNIRFGVDAAHALNSFHPETPDAETIGFLTGKRLFFVLARRSRDCAEAYIMYVAQAIPKIDTARAEKSPFRTETKYLFGSFQTGCQNEL